MGEVKIYYFLLELFLEELSNINHFTLKSIMTELIILRINFTMTEPNTHLNAQA